MAKIKAEIIEALERYLDDVEGVCHVDRAFIFGSYAKGRAGENSDIDMAIFSRNINEKNRLEVLTKVVALTAKFKMDIQPLVFSYEDYHNEENEFISTAVKKDGFELRRACL